MGSRRLRVAASALRMHTAKFAGNARKKKSFFRKQNTTLKKQIFVYKRRRIARSCLRGRPVPSGLSAKSGDFSLTGDKSGGCSARIFASSSELMMHRRDTAPSLFLNDSVSVSAAKTSAENHMDVVALVLNTLTVVLGIPGNSLVIWVVGCKPKSANVLNVWLVNLAMADLIFCITRIFSLVKKLFLGHWPFGLFICKINGFFKYANMFSSVFMLAVISVDRALCVRLPVFTRRHRTVCAARVVATCVWVVVLAFSWPYFSKHNLMCNQDIAKCQLNNMNGLYIVRFLFGFLLPFLVILACYILAGVGIHRTRLSGKWRVLGVLALLVATFFLCWAPYHGLLILKMVDRNCALLKTWMPLARGVAFIKSGINPLLYFFVGLRMRTPAKKSLTGLYRSALADNPDRQTGQSNDNGLGLSKSEV